MFVTRDIFYSPNKWIEGDKFGVWANIEHIWRPEGLLFYLYSKFEGRC